ncbi:hypothetical protein D9756_005472 [Leucocoprinus leucothites]|uniref:Uncharacterized protein n=1 Tax=Leucocoprinus leucothites TaxID=201217 RepID=A0A8H5D8M4_9AGAR|nr:hypothetical protein D9756_005472 [Leucoagaricus leucothites]
MGAKLSKQRKSKGYQGRAYALDRPKPHRHDQSEAIEDKKKPKTKFGNRFFKPKAKMQGGEAEHRHPKPLKTGGYDSKEDSSTYPALTGYDVSFFTEDHTRNSNTTAIAKPITGSRSSTPGSKSAAATLTPKKPQSQLHPEVASATPVPTKSKQQPPPYFSRKESEPIVVNGKRFYRPGEVGHPAYKPTSTEWMRRHGMGQNALVKRKAKNHTTNSSAGALAKSTTEPTSSGALESPNTPGALVKGEADTSRANKVPLDNVLDAETYDGMFHKSEIVQRVQGGQNDKEPQELREMKFYRPGDPDHQAVRPVTDKFKRKHSALASLSRLQNEFVQYD